MLYHRKAFILMEKLNGLNLFKLSLKLMKSEIMTLDDLVEFIWRVFIECIKALEILDLKGIIH